MKERLTHPEYVAEPRPKGGRLSTAGHGEAFRAFCRAARRMRARFLLIGGTYRDVRVRAMSTQDIDVVLVDRETLAPDVMAEHGFVPVEGSIHAWRYVRGDRAAEIQVSAVASSRRPTGPFSIALRDSEAMTIEGERVRVPRIEDWVILKLLAGRSNYRRTGKDVVDVQYAIEAYPEHRDTRLSVPAVRARLRDAYGISGSRLRELAAHLRVAHRRAAGRPAPP